MKNCKFDGQPILYFEVEPEDSPLLSQATIVAWECQKVPGLTLFCQYWQPIVSPLT